MYPSGLIEKPSHPKNKSIKNKAHLHKKWKKIVLHTKGIKKIRILKFEKLWKEYINLAKKQSD